MADILELIAAAIWAWAGVYVWITLRRFNRRCDRLIGEIEADIYRGER